eukprot:Hpha_TRINITY_DN28261_c0_g1::TRINITY_DN28261_c0_g1_i1::g.116779::m.116779
MAVLLQASASIQAHPPDSSHKRYGSHRFQRRRPDAFPIQPRQQHNNAPSLSRTTRRLSEALRFNAEVNPTAPLSVQVGEILGWVAEANRKCSREFDDATQQSFLTSTAEPPLSLASYITRIKGKVRDARGGGVWVFVMELVDRLCKTGKIECTPLTVHRLVLVALVLVLKQTNEYSFSLFNLAWAGGVSVMDLITMEAAFLYLIDWDVIIRASDLDTALCRLPALRTAARNAAADALDSGLEGSPVTPDGATAAVDVMPPSLEVMNDIAHAHTTTTPSSARRVSFTLPLLNRHQREG